MVGQRFLQRRFRAALLAIASMVMLPSLSYARAMERPLHLFKLRGGIFPLALALGPNGVLYGTTSSGPGASGGLFSLTPPASTSDPWTYQVLYRFGNERDTQKSGLLVDQLGNIYGSSSVKVYQLSPPTNVAGQWTETNLASFVGAKGYDDPNGELVMDENGAVYGTTFYGGDRTCIVPGEAPLSSGCGSVFKLTPSSAGWSKTTIYGFRGSPDGDLPTSGVLIDANGTIYGTTLAGGPAALGTVFRLTPPANGAGPYDETVLFSFRKFGTGGFYPDTGLVADASGALYGTLADCNGDDDTKNQCSAVFRLTPPPAGASAWTETILHTFPSQLSRSAVDSLSKLTIDASGALYGANSFGGPTYDGQVFKLSPPAEGTGEWISTTLHTFTPRGFSARSPSEPLVIGSDGSLYGTAEGGIPVNETISGGGVAFEITP